MEKIFTNYETFYNMVLATTLLTNAPTPQSEEDGKKIVRFIASSYRLDDETTALCEQVIFDELVSLGLTTDQKAVYGNRRYGDQYTDKDVLFDIKGDVLAKLQRMCQKESSEVNANWFDYSHYKTYQPSVRTAKIVAASAAGDLVCNRQAAILKTLGIGCEVDLADAIHRFKQCVFWGDIPSMFMLSSVYKLSGNIERSSMVYELAQISTKYLRSGYTVIPAADAVNYSEDARTYYVYVSTIKQDIIYAYNRYDIDFSFIEAITFEGIDHFQRMNYINNYEHKEWKNVTNSAVKPKRELGFK